MQDDKHRLSAEFMADRYRLMAFIRGFVHDYHATEDIFQEVWMRLSKASEGDGEEIRDTARWCRGVAKNLILHHWRDRQRSKVTADSELLDLAELAFDEQDAEASFWGLRAKALQECLEGLPQRSSRVLELKYHLRYSIEAIVRQMGGTIASVTKLLSRVRQALGRCVEKRLQREGVRP
jgi:RNA polymerase sigma factor (sigma-70 family)